MTIHLELLQIIPYFAGFSAPELEQVKKVFFEKSVTRGEIILLENDLNATMYFVASGVVKVYKTSFEGKEQILWIARPVDSFNDNTVFDDKPNPASAEALENTLLYGINKPQLDSLLRAYPKLSLNANGILSNKIRGLLSLVEDLSLRKVGNRLAKVLLELAESETNEEGRKRITQQEIASRIGTVREVIGRSLRNLELEGIIRIDRNRISIIDKEKLKTLI